MQSACYVSVLVPTASPQDATDLRITEICDTTDGGLAEVHFESYEKGFFEGVFAL